MSISQFPHCDARVLHAPGKCEYCDHHPDWQELRQAWGIAFTGHKPTVGDADWTKQLPCPADYNRPPGAGNDHRRWAGNVATTATPVNETAASRMLYGTMTREVTPADKARAVTAFLRKSRLRITKGQARAITDGIGRRRR